VIALMVRIRFFESTCVAFTIDRAKVNVITTFILDLTDGKPRNILDIISSIKFCLG
jgi:hypothetical protein